MHPNHLRRARWRVLGLCLGLFAGMGGVGCGGQETGETPEKPEAGPAHTVTSCTLSHQTAVGPGQGISPAIAFQKGRFAVVWTDTSQDAGDIRLALLDADGRSPQQVPVAVGPGTATAPAVAALPDGSFLVAWEELAATGGVVRAQRFDAHGRARASSMTVAPLAGPEAHPDVASTSKDTAVAWTEAAGGWIGQVTADGIGSRLALPGATQVAIAGRDQLAAVWRAGTQLAFSKVTFSERTGVAASPLLFRTAVGLANMPRLAAAKDGSFGVVWEDARAGADHEGIYVARIGADGKAGPEVKVSPGQDWSANFPDMVWLGNTALVSYYQFRDGPAAVYLSLISSDGRLGQELRVAGHGARFPRLAVGPEGTVGLAYAQRNGPVQLAMVRCK